MYYVRLQGRSNIPLWTITFSHWSYIMMHDAHGRNMNVSYTGPPVLLCNQGCRHMEVYTVVCVSTCSLVFLIRNLIVSLLDHDDKLSTVSASTAVAPNFREWMSLQHTPCESGRPPCECGGDPLNSNIYGSAIWVLLRNAFQHTALSTQSLFTQGDRLPLLTRAAFDCNPRVLTKPKSRFDLPLRHR